MARILNWYLACVLIKAAVCQVRPATDLQDALQTLGLTKFLQALREAGLSHILYNGDKCTLFAPTNEAFARLEVRALHSKGSALTKDEVKRILLYHAAYSEWRAEDWANDELIPTALPGMNMRVNIYEQPRGRKGDEKVISLSGVQVLSTNNRARNGIVHVLNDVVYPMPVASAYNTLASLPALSHFKSLLDEFKMMKLLRYEEPLTIFAPINDAFKKLPPQFMDNISLQPAAMAGDTDHRYIKLNNDATVLHSHPVTNGVLHVVDAMLFPPANPKQMLYASKNGVQYDAQKGLRKK